MATFTAKVTDSQGNSVTQIVPIALGNPVFQVTGTVTLDGKQVIPAGTTWEFNPDVTSTLILNANLVVAGTLRARPSSASVVHTTRFVNVDESKYVGGGHDILDSDVGLWCAPGGKLDLFGTPRAGWNRTGTDPTWRAGDEIRVTPSAPGATAFPTFTPGSPVPYVTSPSGRVQKAEVFNLTRNVRIEGTANGRAHCNFGDQAHTLKYVRFDYLGPRVANPAGGTLPVLGRYPMHWHHAGDGTRGTVVEGCVVTKSSRAMVAHGSNGIRFKDCIAYDIQDSAYWWDEGHPSADVVYEHCAAFGVKNDPTFRGLITGFLLGIGTGNKVIDCVAVGVKGAPQANGFNWPEFANFDPNVWEARDLVAHHCNTGVYAWQNDSHDHVIENLTVYNNVNTGLVHGAYVNYYRYHNVLAFGHPVGDIRHQAVAQKEVPSAQEWLGLDIGVLALGEKAKLATPTASRTTHIYGRIDKIIFDEKVSTQANPFGVGDYVIHLPPGCPDPVVQVKVKVSTVLVERADGSTYAL